MEWRQKKMSDWKGLNTLEDLDKLLMKLDYLRVGVFLLFVGLLAFQMFVLDHPDWLLALTGMASCLCFFFIGLIKILLIVYFDLKRSINKILEVMKNG